MDSVHIDCRPGKMGGQPCLRGTRFTLASVIAELAEGDTVQGISKDFDLDADIVSGALMDLSVYLSNVGEAKGKE